MSADLQSKHTKKLLQHSLDFGFRIFEDNGSCFFHTTLKLKAVYPYYFQEWLVNQHFVYDRELWVSSQQTANIYCYIWALISLVVSLKKIMLFKFIFLFVKLTCINFPFSFLRLYILEFSCRIFYNVCCCYYCSIIKANGTSLKISATGIWR